MFRTESTGSVNGLYVDGPPASIIESAHLNTIQEEICSVIEGAGGTVRQKGNNINTQLLNALQTYFFQDMFDVVVTNQTQFNALFERTGANAYKIKDAYRSVFIKNNGVGYLCAGAGSFLASGDSYAVISTNYCAHLVMQSGSYMDVGNERGYLTVNTDDCVLDNVWIKGLGTVASAIQYSFLLNAYRATFNNCKTSNRLSNTAFYGFYGSGTVGHNNSSVYNNCIVRNIVTSGANTLCGFSNVKFINNCKVETISGGTSDIVGFRSCEEINSSHVTDLSGTSGTLIGFNDCHSMVSCKVTSIITVVNGQGVHGFNNCYEMSACRLYILQSTTGNCYAFVSCQRISGCQASGLSTTTGTCLGFYNCIAISSCTADSVSNSGAGSAIGFSGCSYISSCQSDSISTVGGTAEGFHDCAYMAACYTTEAVNSGCSWVCTKDAQIVAGNDESVPQIFT